MPFDGNQVLNRDQEIVQGAQECLAKHGWTTGQLVNLSGEHCVMGAILMGARGKCLFVNHTLSDRLDYALLLEATSRGVPQFGVDHAGWNTAVFWNNNRAKDAAEVIDFLECVKERLADGV